MNTNIEILGSTEKYVKLDELAAVLDVKPETVSDWTRRFEDFPHMRLPGAIRVRPSEVMDWLQQFQGQPLRKVNAKKREEAAN